MIIIGINGWTERGHDASASLVKDGTIVSAAEEERFTRKKHAYDTLPISSIKFCLDNSSLSIDDIDKIGISWNFPLLYKLHAGRWSGAKKLSRCLFGSEEYAPKIQCVDHHLSHAGSAYFPSGYDEALILVVDGQGEIFSTSVWYGSDGRLKLVKGYNVNASLGYFYSAATEQLGFRQGEEGKTMGLSAYGSPVYKGYLRQMISYAGCKDNIITGIRCSPNEASIDEEEGIMRKWHAYFDKRIIKAIGPLHKIGRASLPYANLAASVQLLLEEIILKLIGYHAQNLGTKNVCIAGGVGLNCQLMGKIAGLPFVERVFVQPAANDAGTSLGAALVANAESCYRQRSKMRVYLGPEFSDKDIRQSIGKVGLHFQRHRNIEKETAYLLSQNKSIAFFQGRMEFGPRALGNRSILANPSSAGMKDKINALKQRELWRPLAPAILEDRQVEYFSKACRAPYMAIAFSVTSRAEKDAPSIVHVDKTARIQTVANDLNARMYGVMKNFESLTGLPVLLNTSFNRRGEPIVCSPDDAINSFVKMNTDYLVMGNYIVENRGFGD